MVNDSSVSVDRCAFRQAGHAAMSYLIRKGFTQKYVPADRSCILPAFEKVSIRGESVDWGELTISLASLITVAQVLLAGSISEKIKFSLRNDIPESKTDSVRRAEHLAAAYMEEYAGKDVDFTERDEGAVKLVRELVQYVEETLRLYWASVETLAAALLENESLSEDEVFEIVGREIPAATRNQAEAFAARDPEEVLKSLLKKMSDE